MNSNAIIFIKTGIVMGGNALLFGNFLLFIKNRSGVAQHSQDSLKSFNNLEIVWNLILKILKNYIKKIKTQLF